MKKYIFLTITLFLVSLNAKVINFDFENNKKTNFPFSWNTQSTWKIVNQNNNKVLFMSSNEFMNDFNFCYKKDLKIKNSTISVDFKSLSGKYDQGGGIMYRVIDNDNYYVVRFNPLEDNLRFYKVINSSRIQLSSANIKLKNTYNNMTLVINNNNLKAYLNSKLLLDVSDSSINKKGSIGVWSKADAKTYFDNLKIKTDE